MTTKISFNEQVNDLEVQEYNNAIRNLAYNARRNKDDIEKLEAALDLFKALQDKLNVVDDLTADQVNTLSQEFTKVRSQFTGRADSIVDGCIAAAKISANSITSTKLKIADLV